MLERLQDWAGSGGENVQDLSGLWLRRLLHLAEDDWQFQVLAFRVFKVFVLGPVEARDLTGAEPHRQQPPTP